jgi:hypothetical protein
MINRVDFLQETGFPFDEQTMDFLQGTYTDAFKAFIGHLGLADDQPYIISGCEINGSDITPGVMYINGKLATFDGAEGTLATKIKLIETIEEAPFETAGNLPTYYSYKAMVNSLGTPLADYVRVKDVQTLGEAVTWDDVQDKPLMVIDPADLTAVPPELTILQRLELLERKNAVFQAGGGMVLWNKPANLIPTGWQEVVNWRGRMPVGVDPSQTGGVFNNPEFAPLTTGLIDPGKTGGAKEVALVAANNGPHSHNVKTWYNGSDGSDNTKTFWNAGGDGSSITENDSTVIKESGSGTPFSILNPYRTVLFIEWIG